MKHYEGRWKDPSGAVVLVAPADQAASGRKFGMYWTLALPDTLATGLWALEVSIDGHPAGTHTFEIRSGRPAAALSAAQLYDRARDAAATVESLGRAGEVSAIAVATALNRDFLATSFNAVDGATRLRIALPDGRRLETREIGAWSRRDGWAVIRVPEHGVAALPRGIATGVGEALFVLDTYDDGGRVIGKTSVVGEAKASATGRRLLLADAVAAGSPVLNGSGEQVGIASASSETTLGEVGVRFARSPVGHSRGSTLLGMDALPLTPDASVSTLDELTAQGQFMRPLSPESRHVISGVFAGKMQRGGVVPMPLDQRNSFARGEGQTFVFVQWNPQEKREAASSYEAYDADNRPVARSQVARLKLKPRELMFSTWGFPIDRLAAGTYRVDLLLDQQPVWRGWVRITD